MVPQVQKYFFRSRIRPFMGEVGNQMTRQPVLSVIVNQYSINQGNQSIKQQSNQAINQTAVSFGWKACSPLGANDFNRVSLPPRPASPAPCLAVTPSLGTHQLSNVEKRHHEVRLVIGREAPPRCRSIYPRGVGLLYERMTSA